MVCKPNAEFIKYGHKLYDPNFVAEPKPATHLTKVVRDVWRMWSGKWTDEDDIPLPTRRDFKIADITYDNFSVERFSTFERIFGKQCYRLWPMAVLRGPSAWFNRLPHDRKQEHLRWVDQVMKFNSMMPAGYQGPIELNQLPRDLLYDSRVPDTQVYINGLPELQDLELTNMFAIAHGLIFLVGSRCGLAFS